MKRVGRQSRTVAFAPARAPGFQPSHAAAVPSPLLL